MSFRIKKTSDEEKTKQSQPQANKIEKFYTQEEIDLIGIKYENPQKNQHDKFAYLCLKYVYFSICSCILR